MVPRDYLAQRHETTELSVANSRLSGQPKRLAEGATEEADADTLTAVFDFQNSGG
jgi:hypothetical protein